MTLLSTGAFVGGGSRVLIGDTSLVITGKKSGLDPDSLHFGIFSTQLGIQRCHLFSFQGTALANIPDKLCSFVIAVLLCGCGMIAITPRWELLFYSSLPLSLSSQFRKWYKTIMLQNKMLHIKMPDALDDSDEMNDAVNVYYLCGWESIETFCEGRCPVEILMGMHSY